jgi:hypothetical protein
MALKKKFKEKTFEYIEDIISNTNSFTRGTYNGNPDRDSKQLT